MENYEWIYDIFAFIGMAVCILIALIAIVWVTCFAIKLLVKTFGVRVGKSYDIMVEDITKKSEAKKERKEIARKASADKKMEILNMKLESKQKIHEMKKQKLAENLAQKEELAKSKIFGEVVAEDLPVQEEEQKVFDETKDEEIVQQKPKRKNSKISK